MNPDEFSQLPPQAMPQGYWYSQYPPYRQRSSLATKIIVGSTIAVFFVQLYFHFILHSGAFEGLMAFSDYSFDNGDYWQVISYAWIHSVTLPIHILFNMLMVWVLGSEIERILGSWRFVVLYLGGAIAAALTFLVWNYYPGEAVAGASGSAFALLTAFAVLCPRRRLSVILIVIPMRLQARWLAVLICGIELVCQLFGFLPFISHSAHLGGALFGALAGWCFKPPHFPDPVPPTASFPSGFFPQE